MPRDLGIFHINLVICSDKDLACFTLRYVYLQMNTSQYRHISAGGNPPPPCLQIYVDMLYVVKMTFLHLLRCRTRVSNVLSFRMVFVSGQSAIYWIALLIILLTTSFDCVNVIRNHSLNHGATLCHMFHCWETWRSNVYHNL